MSRYAAVLIFNPPDHDPISFVGSNADACMRETCTYVRAALGNFEGELADLVQDIAALLAAEQWNEALAEYCTLADATWCGAPVYEPTPEPAPEV